MNNDLIRFIVSSISTFFITAGTAYGAMSVNGDIPRKGAIITLLVGAGVQTARHVQALLTDSTGVKTTTVTEVSQKTPTPGASG